MSHATKVLAALALWSTANASNATAQDSIQAAQECPAGSIAIGDLGYERLQCSNCTQYVHEGQSSNNRWQFNAEPVIMTVRRGGPAHGKLEDGDVIVAIDGALITSAEGGRHFGQLEPGEPIDLTVRREGRELTIEITPTADCRRTPRAAPLPPAPIQDRVTAPRVQVVAPRPPTPLPPLPSALPRAWFGFSLRCSDCGISLGDGADQVWRFSSPPIIEDVEPEGPAHRAGIRLGDRITTIDGVDITTPDGGTSFGRVLPGDTVTFGIQRNNVDRTVQIVAGMRERSSPAPRPAGVVRARPQPDVRRFSGVIGDALVEVTGGPITVRRTEDEIVIRSGDITVRIKRTDP